MFKRFSNINATAEDLIHNATLIKVAIGTLIRVTNKCNYVNILYNTH